MFSSEVPKTTVEQKLAATMIKIVNCESWNNDRIWLKKLSFKEFLKFKKFKMFI
jgi:hypothetical protein